MAAKAGWHRNYVTVTLCIRHRATSRGANFTAEDHINEYERRRIGERYDTIRYDTRCHFNVRSKANISQLNLPHRKQKTDN